MLQPSPTQRAPYRAHDSLSEALAAERPHVTRLCQRLTGDAVTAEDLTQETLLTAWRLRDRVSAPEGLSAWLAAIARNHCRRWARAHGADRARVISLDGDDGDPLAEWRMRSLATDDADPAETIEREEMAALARRALALAPHATRDLLAAVYLAEVTASEAARERGVSEGALRVRLARARQALREALAADEDLRAEIEDLGLTLPTSSGWTESRIWCPFCGVSHLRYRIDRETGEYAFHCAAACPGYAVAGNAQRLDLVRAVSSPKSLLARHCLTLDSAYRSALQGNQASCDCGERMIYIHNLGDFIAPSSPILYGIVGECSRCGPGDSATAWHLALDTIEAQRFWRRYPRMRALPMRAVECDGRDVIVTGFEAIGAPARLDIVSDAHDYTVLLAQVSHAR